MASAKVTPTSMNTWSTKMNSINESASSLLDTMDENLRELEGYWEGNAEDKSITATLELTNQTRTFHNNMKEVSDFLVTTSNTMSNQ